MSSTLSNLPSGAARFAAVDHATQAVASQADAVVDAGLVRRAQAGDDAAFAEIVNRHRRKIFARALACARNYADAEDLTQETFIRAQRGLARFRGDSSLATWLHYIAINLARNHSRYGRTHRWLALSLDAPPDPNSDGALIDVVASEAPDPAQLADAGEFSAILTACIGRLPAAQREILTLCGLRQRSYGEIAGTLRLNLGTVKSRIARARENLRAQIGALYPERGLGRDGSHDRLVAA